MKKKKKEKVEAILEKKNEITEDEVKLNKYDDLSRTLILALFGLVLLLLPEEFNKIIGLILGAILLIVGLIGIIKYIILKEYKFTVNLISAILYAALGIIVIFYPFSIINLITICLGLYLVISGVIKTIFSFTLKRITDKWIGSLVMGLITIVLGCLLIFNPFASIAITKLAGAFLVVAALFDIINNFIIVKH